MIVREARPEDAPAVVRLIGQLAADEGEKSPVTEADVCAYLSYPGCALLVAEADGQVVGLVSTFVRPSLYHAAPAVMADDLVVSAGCRGQGIGRALLDEVLRRAYTTGCAEVSVAVMPDNADALRFYRSHGLTDEAVFLEKHF
jgi:ribosomal protein S18 acetylase RimI-like enzyme